MVALERIRSFAQRYQRVVRWILPIMAFKTGIITVFLMRQGVDFAPVAVAILISAWSLAAVVVRYLAPRDGEHGAFGVARFVATGFVASLYQNVLFFLLPIWFGSATWPSHNMFAPIILAGMAIISCFDQIYARGILQHPARRSAFSAVVLFATLVAATPVYFQFPLRPNFAVAAALSTILGAITGLPKGRLRSMRTIAAVSGAAIVAAVVMAVFAPMFPPVPIESMKVQAATAIVEREPEGVADEFDAGVERVYVWFAIAAPERYSQKVRFEWFRDGIPLEKTWETEITGGRKAGFRTWGVISNPHAGKWRVDLYADSDQLIGRRRFTVR